MPRGWLGHGCPFSLTYSAHIQADGIAGVRESVVCRSGPRTQTSNLRIADRVSLQSEEQLRAHLLPEGAIRPHARWESRASQRSRLSVQVAHQHQDLDSQRRSRRIPRPPPRGGDAVAVDDGPGAGLRRPRRSRSHAAVGEGAQIGAGSGLSPASGIAQRDPPWGSVSFTGRGVEVFRCLASAEPP